MDIFELVLWLVEFVPYILIGYIGLAAVIIFSLALNTKKSIVLAVVVPIVLVVLMITGVFVASWEQAYLDGYDLFAPSLRSEVESYIVNGDRDDLEDILESGRYAPKLGLTELKYFVKDLLAHTVIHTDANNEENIDEAYNKGNDWFEKTLGKETMVYTSGFYSYGNETLTEAQHNKIDHVANVIQVQPDDHVLDIGCGWGYLTKRFTENYGAKVTGLTLSKEQMAWGTEWNKDNEGATILLQDAMKINDNLERLPVQKFDKITSLEMAEHVGIRRYQEFLKIVHNLLKDDGVFYFQVAGLRRSWKYEDFVWGLFMGEHVFPGADASCPLGWVTTQLERAGFEVQMVHNLGTHYSRTLAHWLENWRNNKDSVIEKYGEKSYRRWEVFLAWSVRIARQGSSTLFSIVATKAQQENRRIETQAHLVPGKESSCALISTSSVEESKY